MQPPTSTAAAIEKRETGATLRRDRPSPLETRRRHRLGQCRERSSWIRGRYRMASPRRSSLSLRGRVSIGQSPKRWPRRFPPPSRVPSGGLPSHRGGRGARVRAVAVPALGERRRDRVVSAVTALFSFAVARGASLGTDPVRWRSAALPSCPEHWVHRTPRRHCATRPSCRVVAGSHAHFRGCTSCRAG